MPEVTVTLRVNGEEVRVVAHPMARLLDVLRQQLHLTGTKEGCGEGECGACSILLNGAIVNSCLVPVIQAAGADVQTIEGLTDGDRLDRVQQAFIDEGGAQCGICTPGMIVAAKALLDANARPSIEQIREALAGNLCRCTGYMRIFEAVKNASEDGREERR